MIDDLFDKLQSAQWFSKIDLRSVLQTLKKHQLYAKLLKCEFWLDEVALLGYMVLRECIMVDPKKVEVVLH